MSPSVLSLPFTSTLVLFLASSTCGCAMSSFWSCKIVLAIQDSYTGHIVGQKEESNNDQANKNVQSLERTSQAEILMNLFFTFLTIENSK